MNGMRVGSEIWLKCINKRCKKEYDLAATARTNDASESGRDLRCPSCGEKIGELN